MDLNRVYIDADSFEEAEKIENDDERFQRCRYSIINASLGFMAKVVHAAIKVKSWAGAQCYAVGAVNCFLSGNQHPDHYRMSVINKVDGEQRITYQRDVETMLFSIMNGRYGGGGMTLGPAALLNDGLLDISYYNSTIRLQTIPWIIYSLGVA